MKCIKCETEMIQSKLSTGMAYVYAANKKEGIFEVEKRSPVFCYVCPTCGYIELYATNPKELKLD